MTQELNMGTMQWACKKGMEEVLTHLSEYVSSEDDKAIKFGEWFDDPPNNDWTEMYLKIGWESGMPIKLLYNYWKEEVHKQLPLPTPHLSEYGVQQQVSDEEKISSLIKQHLGFEPKTDDKWWLQASIKNYVESGKPSGSLYKGILDIINSVQIEDRMSQENVLKRMDKVIRGFEHSTPNTSPVWVKASERLPDHEDKTTKEYWTDIGARWYCCVDNRWENHEGEPLQVQPKRWLDESAPLKEAIKPE